jgi:hypothetical protein
LWAKKAAIDLTITEKGDTMNPFDANGPLNRGRRPAPEINFVQFPQPKSVDEIEYGSVPERVIGKGVATLKRIMTLILVIAGLFTLGALAPPFVRFLYEFSRYAYLQAGRIFP